MVMTFENILYEKKARLEALRNTGFQKNDVELQKLFQQADETFQKISPGLLDVFHYRPNDELLIKENTAQFGLFSILLIGIELHERKRKLDVLKKTDFCENDVELQKLFQQADETFQKIAPVTQNDFHYYHNDDFFKENFAQFGLFSSLVESIEKKLHLTTKSNKIGWWQRLFRR